jgi:DNA-binding transcriptional MocR family regulator
VDQDKRAQFVERWARLHEVQGEPRIGGRIFAHLATAQEPYLSLQQLADQLGVSRASVSTNTRRLIDRGLIVRVAVPGARGDHYACSVMSLQEVVAKVATAAREFEALAAEGLRLQPGAVTPGTQSLRALSDIYLDLAETLEGIAAGGRRRPRRRAAQ